MMDLSKIKLEITYPAKWQYKVVGTNRAMLEREVIDVVFEKDYTISFSHASSGGKYVSLSVDVVVDSEEERNLIFQRLTGLKSVARVI